MSVKAVIFCIAAMACAAPVAAQQRGTMEFGAFGSAGWFDDSLSLKTGYGGGGRIGMYLDPRWAIEFEDAEMRASRPNGLKDVNVGLLSGRLVFAAFKSGAFSVLLGGGAGVSTETNFLHSYGVDALAGVKFDLSNQMAIRVDGVWDWLANYDWKSYRSLRAGLSLYRHPSHIVDTVIVRTPPVMMAPRDSVSSDEIRRLRDADAALRALRDSLSRNPPRAQPTQSIPIRKEPAPTKP